MAKLQIWNTQRINLSKYFEKGLDTHQIFNNLYRYDTYRFSNFGLEVDNKEINFKIYIKNLTNKKIKQVSLFLRPINVDNCVMENLDIVEWERYIVIKPQEFKHFCIDFKNHGDVQYSDFLKYLNSVWLEWKKYRIVDLKIIKAHITYSNGSSEMIDASEILFQEPNNGELQFFQNKEKNEKRQKRSDFIGTKIIPYVIVAIILLIMFAFAARDRKESEWSKLSEEEKQTIRDNMEFYDKVKDAADKYK